MVKVTDEKLAKIAHSGVGYLVAYDEAVNRLEEKELDNLRNIFKNIVDQLDSKHIGDERNKSMNELYDIIDELGNSDNKNLIKDFIDSIAVWPSEVGETGLGRPFRI